MLILLGYLLGVAITFLSCLKILVHKEAYIAKEKDVSIVIISLVLRSILRPVLVLVIIPFYWVKAKLNGKTR